MLGFYPLCQRSRKLKWWRPFKYRTGALLVILEPDPHNIHQEWLALAR